MRPTLTLVLACLGALAPAAACADELTSLLARMTAAGQSTRTLTADFTQRKRMPMFRSEVVSRGRVAFRRPDRLRWQIFPPDAMVLIVRGERAELRVADDPPRMLDLKAGSSLASLVEQVLVWFGVRPAAELRKAYTLTVRSHKKGGETQLRAVPKDPALRQRVASLEVSLDEHLEPRQLLLVGAEGEVTRIEFGPVRKNVPVNDVLFR